MILLVLTFFIEGEVYAGNSSLLKKWFVIRGCCTDNSHHFWAFLLLTCIDINKCLEEIKRNKIMDTI